MSTQAKTGRPEPIQGTYVDTAPFWTAVAQDRLLVQRCNQTGKLQYPPRPVSVYTGRRDLSWVPVSGRAVLYSWTLTHSAWPGHEARVPYLCAYVELEEGLRLLTNLITSGCTELYIGMPLRLHWETLDSGQRYPAFAPDPARL